MIVARSAPASLPAKSQFLRLTANRPAKYTSQVLRRGLAVSHAASPLAISGILSFFLIGLLCQDCDLLSVQGTAANANIVNQTGEEAAGFKDLSGAQM